VRNYIVLCIAGKNSIAVDVLTYALTLLDKNKIVGVPNNSDTGEDGWQPSFLKKCCDEGIKCAHLHQLYDMEMVFLSLEFDRIVVPERFRSKYLYNMHFSKLPQYRGMYTSSWPLLNSETESGVTLHKIDNSIDTGDIIDQISFRIDKKDTARDLYFKYLKYGTMLVKANLLNILNHKITGYPQPIEGSSYYAKESINYSDLKIDFKQTADNIVKQIRAFSFEEYQLPKMNGRRIKDAIITNRRSTKKPLNIIEENEEYIILSTIDYDILIKWE
jgi:methionyl-tRNA formyltransferase